MADPQRPATREPVDDGACFACGAGNPRGLHLEFEPVGDDGARAVIELDAALQGYRGIAHGGIVMMLLDEVMAHAAGNAGDKVMTAAVAVRFRGPVPLGVPITLAGRVVSRRGKVLKIEGAVRDGAGTLLAAADGSFVRLGPVDPVRFGNFARRRAV
jgi:uncharacterized protein (TIGR00369 family)